MPNETPGSGHLEQREDIGSKVDVISRKPLAEKRKRWVFSTRETSEGNQIFQFYVACPDSQLEAVVSYLNEGFNAKRLPNVVMLEGVSGSGVLDKLREVLLSESVEDDQRNASTLLVVMQGFTEMFAYWHRRNERSGRVGHDYNQEVAEQDRSEHPLPIPPQTSLIVITHIRYLPDSVGDESAVMLEAIGAAASSKFAADIVEIDPPAGLRALQSALDEE